MARMRLAKSLISRGRQRQLILLIVGKVLLGCGDLLLATLVYELFVLLQRTGPGFAEYPHWVPQSVGSVAGVSLAVVMLRSFGEIALTRGTIAYTQGLYADFLLRLAESYGVVRWEDYVQRNRSELLKYCSVTALDAAYAYQLLIEAISAALVVGLLGVALFYKGVWIACTLLLFSFGMLCMHRFWLGGRMQAAASARERASRVVQIGLAELFSSAKEIRAYRNAAFFQARLREEAANLGEANVRLGVLPQISRTMAEQGVVIAFLGVVLAVQLWHGDVHRLLALLVFYFVLSRRLLPLIGQATLNLGQMEGAYENLEIVQRELRRNAVNRTPNDAVELPQAEYALELEHVGFAFAEGAPVLKDVELHVAHGEVVILRGVSGAGKSSLLNLVAGVAQPTNGVVRVDRSALAYVPQEITLLDDSIRINLLFGLAEIGDEELMRALTAASLSEFVRGLPLGLDTRVGDNGVLFSGGQRQRLGLARALVRRPKLLLLDEATSALDAENERMVLENMQRAGGPAILMVTHRVTGHYPSARIFSIANGRLRLEDSSDSAS